ncbi:DUF1648 domain-containing protein [Dietzia alimentaria]|uniref:DUF1648 domain-containing protein n=1 Tax=Dietzia alimentaria TaxID=665550 RepID=UPI00029A0CDC|nr:DUF1648 domain-containing protein [Dietzia alimentaria]
MTTTSSSAEDARGLPREPTARWILVLIAGLTVVWLGALAWQVAVLPELVATHFDSSGEPDGWSSRASALAISVLGPLAVAFPMPLMSLLVIRWPQSINAPNREWWTATGPRLRRFERLLREDLWLISAATLLLLVMVQVGITETAISDSGAMPMVYVWAPIAVVLVGVGAVMIRMLGSRYGEQSDLA